MDGSDVEVDAAMLTVAVPGEADPNVVIFGVVQVPDELHLRPAVERRQISPDGLAVVPRIRPREALLAVVHVVTVTAVGVPERQTHPVTGGRCRRGTLCKVTRTIDAVVVVVFSWRNPRAASLCGVPELILQM